MEADWDEITRIAVPQPGPQAPPAKASCVLAFDDTQELLWTGNEHVSQIMITQIPVLMKFQGRVTSFYGRDLQRYTSVKAHTNEGEVKQLLIHEKGIISLASRSVHLITRRGLTQWHLTHERMLDLRCMSFTSTSAQLLIAGCQSSMFVIDVDRGILLEELPAPGNYTMMKKGRHICAATDDGTIHVMSTASLEVLTIWKAAVVILDMDARGDFLVTCRSTPRQSGNSIVDPLANVYDLKSLKHLSPIPFPAGAALIRLHPKLQTTSFVASQTGQMQVVDLMNPISIIMRQANVHSMQGMELSPSGNALAITDHQGFIHLWGSPANIRFNNVSKAVEFADSSPTNLPHVDWTDAPLNTIGMPYYHDRLLSAWPSHLVFDVGAPPPPPLEPAMMPDLQAADIGLYYENRNPKGLHRYQVEDTRALYSTGSIAAPKFLSERAKQSSSKAVSGSRLSDAVEALAGITLNGKAQTDEERMLKYSNVEIKYSRFGVDDFDFKYYNKTPFSGLETHIANSFINSLLQLYKFIPRIRNLALHHTATRCVSENCLMCEFGFLFDMLEKASGQNCQATNLLRAFGANREAAALGLFEELSLASGVPLAQNIQSVNRFFLKHLATDWRAFSGTNDAVDEVLATSAFEVIRCMYCGNETNRPGIAYVHDLVYPQLDPKHGMHNAIFMFSSILKATIERESKNRGWCNKCRRYQQLAIRKIIQHLPVVLMLNAALTNSAMRVLWEKPGWLPQKVGIVISNRQVFCLEGKDLERELQRNPTIAVYELVGFVAGVDVNEWHQPHLVSMVNVDVSKKPAEGVPKHRGFPDWHLFNDFLVQPVDPREALDFSKSWKLPSVLAYQLQSAHGMVDDNWKAALDTSLLYHPYSINGLAPTADCIILNGEDNPKEGSPIALDTEFVDLQKAEIDVKADGTQETIRPARSGLARVSVLRGQGDLEGTPFIDDYITIYETIVDYKTQFSGIRPGDLDTRISHHNLVPLKVAYKKLWLLLNLGCVFVGHGLASDFRKVNIQVPKSQTVDTQYLYLAPGRNRRFSLKYLAWAVFKEYIQEETYDISDPDGHDSIEDARMALRLWRKFQEYEDAAIAEQMIEDIYRKGSKYNWKPPARDGTVAASNSGLPSGRNTPDMNGASTPGTPARGLLRLSATSAPAFIPGVTSFKESPLR